MNYKEVFNTFEKGGKDFEEQEFNMSLLISKKRTARTVEDNLPVRHIATLDNRETEYVFVVGLPSTEIVVIYNEQGIARGSLDTI